MEITQILGAIDEQIAMLQEARDLLSGTPKKRGPGRPPKGAISTEGKRTLSPEARAKIAAAQKKRWAAKKKVA